MRTILALLLTCLCCFGQRTQPLNPTLKYGLVGWWTLNESSGNAQDACGISGLAYATNNVLGTNGVMSGGRDFGAGQFLLCPSSALSLSALTNSFSYSAWVFCRSPGSGSQTPVVRTINTRAASGFGWDIVNTTARASAYIYELTPYPIVTSTSAISTNAWTHLCVTYNFSNTNATLYVNGSSNISAVASARTARPFNAETLCVGAFRTASSTVQSFNGIVDDVRVYNRALSAAEVKALYGGGYGAQ